MSFSYRHAFRQTLCGKKRRRNNPQQQLGVAGESMANRPQNSQHRSYIFKSNLRQHHHGGMYLFSSKSREIKQINHSTIFLKIIFSMKVEIISFHEFCFVWNCKPNFFSYQSLYMLIIFNKGHLLLVNHMNYYFIEKAQKKFVLFLGYVGTILCSTQNK